MNHISMRVVSAALVNAALLMASVPVAAAPADGNTQAAQRLSLNPAIRASAARSGRENKLDGGVGGITAIAIGAGIVAIGVLAAVISNDDSDNDNPASP